MSSQPGASSFPNRGRPPPGTSRPIAPSPSPFRCRVVQSLGDGHLLRIAAAAFVCPRITVKALEEFATAARVYLRSYPNESFTSLAELFSRPKRLKSQPLARSVVHRAGRPHSAARYFQISFQWSRLAGVSLLAEDCPSPRSGQRRFFLAARCSRRRLTVICLENTFEVRAHSSSPQGARRVGRQLFDNLKSQAPR